VAPATDVLIFERVLVFAIVLPGACARRQLDHFGYGGGLRRSKVRVFAPIPVTDRIGIDPLKRPVGCAVRKFPDDAPFADAGGGVICRVRQDCVSVKPCISSPKNVMAINVEGVQAIGIIRPDRFARDVHHVGGVLGDGVNAVAGILITGAAIHAVINAASGIEHLRAVEKIRSHLSYVSRNGRGDDAVRENHITAAHSECDICADTVGATACVIRQKFWGKTQDQAQDDSGQIHLWDFRS